MNKTEYIKMRHLEDSHFWFLAKRKFVDSVLQKYKSKIKNILDVGSGTGGMTKHLERYCRVRGIEKNKLAIELSKDRKLNIIQGSASNLPFKKDKFDLVTFFDVLYHRNVVDEKIALGEAKRVLKKNGFILITDSAYNFLYGNHDLATHAKRRYLLDEISDIAKESGFKIIKETYIYSSILPIVLFKRLVFDRFNKSTSSDVSELPALLNVFFLNILKLESYIIRYLNLKFGLSVLVLAQKV